MMEINFTGQRALVTGAAQGIGLAVVKKLVACGAEVVALDIQEDKLRDAVKELPGVDTAIVDLSNWESIMETLKTIGQVDLVANVAGICFPTPFDKINPVDIDKIIDVNLKGVMAVCKHVVNDWTSSGVKGAIVNIASGAATRPDNFGSVYGISKAGVLYYSQCLALDCAPKGIRVNVVSPGIVLTELLRSLVDKPEESPVIARLVPMPEKLIDPEDIANAVVFLLCNKLARKITGVDLKVDAGRQLT